MLKLIFSIILVIAFQQAILSSLNREGRTLVNIESNLQIQYEEDNDSPDIFGEVSACYAMNTISETRTNCYFNSYKSNEFSKALNNVNIFLKTTGNSFFVSADCGIIYIPLYLQTQNLLI